MPRFINPVPQFNEDDNSLLAGGKVFVYESGTTTDKPTYSDEAETTPNTQPIILDAAGRLPNVFFTGTANVVLKTSSDVQIWARDPVGSSVTVGDFTDWNNTFDYEIGEIVNYAGKHYKSLQNPNQNNQPDTSAAFWEEIRFLGVYNVNVDYAVGDVTQTTDGNLWASQVTPNINNDPTTDSGTNWLPAIDGSKVTEIIDLTLTVTHTGGGVLSAQKINELQDAGAYTLPLANTIDAEQWLDLSKSDANKAFSPTMTAAGSDTITWSGGSDTSLQLDNGTISYRRLISDGVSIWRLQ